MSPKKNKNKKKSNNKYLQIVAGAIIIALAVYIVSDLQQSKSKVLTVNNKTVKNDVYEFKKEGELSFQSSEGDFISSLDIELAENDYERTEGLKYRTNMEENQGMLFIFPYEAIQSFWMKSTVISLDMIFINSNMEIVTIHRNTEPYDEGSYRSTAPAQYVLETVAGYTKKYDINQGDRVIFRKTN